MSFSIVDSTSSATVVLGGDSFTLCVFLGTTVFPGLLPYEMPRKFYKVVTVGAASSTSGCNWPRYNWSAPSAAVLAGLSSKKGLRFLTALSFS